MNSTTTLQDALVLRYKRLPEKVSGEYPYSGTLVCAPVEAVFEAWSYRQIIECVHLALKEHVGIQRVVFQRTERPGIIPYELGPNTVALLRRDPEAAYQSMNFNTESSVMASGSGEGNTFGRHLYLRAAKGQVEDPITGTWLTFAYGEKIGGWAIRAASNDTSKWLRLVGLIDSAPDGVKPIERLAFTRWALIDVEELLRQNVARFYLPRPWNLNGPWITHEELQHLYNKSKETLS